MLKKVARFSYVILILLMLISCGEPQEQNAIFTPSFFSDRSILIPLKVKATSDGPHTVFVRTMSIIELGEKLSDVLSNKVNTENEFDVDFEYIMYQDCILIKQEDESGVSYYIIRPLTTVSGQQMYVFSGMGTHFSLKDDIKWLIEIIFPIHLLTDVTTFSQDGEGFRNTLDTSYEINATKEDFLDFYKSINKYEITETNDGFVIEGYNKEISPITRMDYPSMEHAITFTFSEENEQTFVTVSTN